MAPDYSTTDLVRYMGLFVGVGVTYTLLEQMGVTNNIVRLVAAFAVGIGTGWLAERLFAESKK